MLQGVSQRPVGQESGEPSESKSSISSAGDNATSGPGSGRVAGSSATAAGGPSGAGLGPPGTGTGAGPDRLSTSGIPSTMPGHALMGGGGGVHLQAPTSTTPEGIGGSSSLHPGFLSLDHHHHHHHHPSPLGSGEIHIKQEVSAGSSTPAKVCQVCNDNASGFHYGVWSCEGCKAFFKRSIQGPVDYMCPATNSCTIDKHRRKSCQACRLRKCYEVGMNKGSQRKERKSSGCGSGPKGKRCRADSTDNVVNSTNGASASKSARRLRSASILEALQKADLPMLECFHDHEQPLSRVHLLNTLIKVADRELVYLINWAKHVPGYTDLTLSDQVHLIECCWMELLLLNCAFRSMEHEGKRLVFAPDFLLDRQLWVVMEMTEILEQVSAVSEQMVQFGVTKEELLLLQATVLVNAEVRKLASYPKIREMQQRMVDALMEVVQRSHPDNIRRVPSLLLLLTHIRQAGERGIAFFQTLKHEGCVTFCDLLTEMLDAHHAASTAAASTVASASVTVSLPSTSSADVVDRKSVLPPQPHLPHGPS
ncbi:hypothetical protein ACOMHN_003307 [Nucella lapillus]